MKTIRIDESEILDGFVVPPECDGQIVEIAYACTEDLILKRVTDKSNDSVIVTAHEWPEGYTTFTAINQKPPLGSCVGQVKIENKWHV